MVQVWSANAVGGGTCNHLKIEVPPPALFAQLQLHTNTGSLFPFKALQFGKALNINTQAIGHNPISSISLY